MKRLFALITGLVLAGSASGAMAKSAEMMLVPTRIVMEKNDRYATVTVKNSGDGIGRYRVELVDASMNEDGSVKLHVDGTRDPFSALDIISISPRSITLKPDEYQTVRILVKRPETLAPGEYRSHLKVKMVENDIDSTTGEPRADAASIQLKPKLVMVIPIIVRQGETSFAVAIDQAKIVKNADGGPQLDMAFALDGNRSVIGDVKVMQMAGGEEHPVTFFPGVAIYRGTAKRDLSVPLDVPKDVDMHKGKLVVRYLTQDKDNPQAMAEKEIAP